MIPGPWKEAAAFFMDAHTGEYFRADAATDMLTHQELSDHEALVREADKKETKCFVDDHVFKLSERAEANIRCIDCLWVRKWKRRSTNTDKGGSTSEAARAGLDHRAAAQPQALRPSPSPFVGAAQVLRAAFWAPPPEALQALHAPVFRP